MVFSVTCSHFFLVGLEEKVENELQSFERQKHNMRHFCVHEVRCKPQSIEVNLLKSSFYN